MRSAGRVTAGLVGGALLLVGCTSGSGPEPVGEAGSCGEISVTDAINADIGPDETVREIVGSGCADGWMFAFPIIGPADGTTEADIEITVVLEAEGQFWIVRDRAEVCGTDDPANQDAYPTDAEVPEDIWPMACRTN